MQSFKGSDFDWDEGNTAKCGKHGVSREEIEYLFQTDPLISRDILHSGLEERLIAIGIGQTSRPLFVVFTTRGSGAQLVRPLSARYMHAKEFRRYAEIGS